MEGTAIFEERVRNFGERVSGACVLRRVNRLTHSVSWGSLGYQFHLKLCIFFIRAAPTLIRV